MKDQTPKLNEKTLTSDQRDKLEKWQQDVKQLQTLEDIASMAQEMLGIMDDNQKDPGRKTLIIDHVTGDDFVKILKNMQEAILLFKDQKAPELPDYATPVVEAVAKLEKALAAAAKAKDVKPVVNVEAPQVNVAPSPVDLRGVEKAVADIPKAFEKAIKLIPKVEIPKTDNTELLKAWEGISEQLLSIENATRSKPLPGSMKVTNTDGTPVGSNPGTGAASLGKAAGSTAGATDVGVAGLQVRDDVLTTVTPTDGKYMPFRGDQYGAGWVDMATTLNSAVDSVAAVGNVASGATDAGNGVKVAGVYNSTKPTFTTGQRGDLQLTSRGAAQTTLYANDSATAISNNTPADTVTAGTNLSVTSFGETFNGTTWDRMLAATNGTNSTGTGIQAVGTLAQLDDTSPTSITENQFGNLRMSADRSLLVVNRATTPTQTSVAGSASSVSLLAANNARKGATITNDSTAILYVKLGATASVTSYTVKMQTDAYYEVPFGYVGAIDGIWASATGNARITEIV